MDSKLRLIDIAKKANVSMGTVDRVVNKRGKVAPKTEKKVMDIIKEFGYQPNLMASSLSSKKKISFAVLVPKPVGKDYWYKILSGIETAEKAVNSFGVKVKNILYDQDDDIQYRELALQTLTAQFDGVLLAPVFHNETIEFVSLLEKAGIPYVFIDSMIDGTHPLCSISQNNFQSGVLAAKLQYYGHKSGDEILMISNISHSDNYEIMEERSHGYKSYFETISGGKPAIHLLEIVNLKFEKLGLLLGEKLLKSPKIRKIVILNSKAHWVARYLNEKNISTIRLLGFDLIEQNITYLQNSTIDFIIFDYAEKQGELGLHILFDHVVSKKETPQRVNMPIHIVTKENLDGFL